MRIHNNGVNPPEAARPTSRPANVEETKAGDAPVVVAPEATAAESTRRRSEAEAETRVAEVKAQIDAGTYKVDFDRLAERIVDEELARAGRR